MTATRSKTHGVATKPGRMVQLVATRTRNRSQLMTAHTGNKTQHMTTKSKTKKATQDPPVTVYGQAAQAKSSRTVAVQKHDGPRVIQEHYCMIFMDLPNATELEN